MQGLRTSKKFYHIGIYEERAYCASKGGEGKVRYDHVAGSPGA